MVLCWRRCSLAGAAHSGAPGCFGHCVRACWFVPVAALRQRRCCVSVCRSSTINADALRIGVRTDEWCALPCYTNAQGVPSLQSWFYFTRIMYLVRAGTIAMAAAALLLSCFLCCFHICLPCRASLYSAFTCALTHLGRCAARIKISRVPRGATGRRTRIGRTYRRRKQDHNAA